MTFGIDSDGNYGYRKPGADTVTPFSSIEDIRCVYFMSESIKFTMNKENTIKTDIDRSDFHRLLSYSITSETGNIGAVCMYTTYKRPLISGFSSNSLVGASPIDPDEIGTIGGSSTKYETVAAYHYISWHQSNGSGYNFYQELLYEFSDDGKLILKIPYWRGQTGSSAKRLMIVYC